MKNTTLRIASLVMIILGSLVANAQSAYYVHFNTGEKQILWTDLVKSMRTSCISVDSTVMADFVTQEIETSDTVYRYPLEAIDSITFRPLPTVYKPGVIKIDDNLFKYVTKCDSLTLYLSDDVPHGILPEPGDLLCTLETNEIVPYGFAGEVARLHDDNGSKIIECTLADLCDIFESYSSSWTAGEEQPLQSRAYNYGEYPWNKTFDLFGVNANSELLGWLHECVTFDNESYLDISASKLVLDAKLHNNMVFRGSTRIEKGHKLFAMGFTGSHTLDCKSGLSGALSFGKDFEVIEIKQEIPNIPLLQISAAAGALVRATVEADFDAALTQTRHTAFYYSWSNTNDDVIKNTSLTMRTENPVVTFDSRAFGGSIEIGAYIETGFNIFDRDFISLYLRAEPAVVKFDGNFGWPIDGLSIASESTDYYKKLLDNANKLSVVGNVGYGVKTGSNPNDYLSVDFGNSIPVYEKEMMRWYQLPIFKNPRAVRDTEDPYIVDLSVEVERPLIKQYPMGFSIFDDNGDKVISEYGDLYQDGDKTYVTLRIDHLDPSKKYVAYPLMKHKEYEILATPSTDVDKAFNVVTDIPINETTGKELDSRSSDHGYELRGRVIGNWDKEWFTSYGFLITEGSDKSLENLLNDGRYVSATGHYYTAADINFYAGHTELEAATVYSYCAVAYMGEIPVYGNVVEFETEKESIEVTTFTSSITKDAATLHAAVTGISSDDPEVPYGFMIWTDNDTKITLNADNIAFYEGEAAFHYTATGLVTDTEYKYVAFYGDYTSKEESFIPSSLRAETGIVSDMGPNYAIIGIDTYVEKTTDSINECYTFGVYYYEQEGDTLCSQSESNIYGNVAWSYKFEDLKPDTKYFYYSFVRYGDKESHGDTYELRTLREDDKEDPIFQINQESSYSHIYQFDSRRYVVSSQRLSTIGGEGLDQYVFALNESNEVHKSLKYGGSHGYVDGKIFPTLKTDVYIGNEPMIIDYDNYTLKTDSSVDLLLKYSSRKEPNEWYFTKIPIGVTYEDKPYLKVKSHDWISGDNNINGIEISSGGSIWFTSIMVDAELWCRYSFIDENGNRKSELVNIATETFELSPNNLNGRGNGLDDMMECVVPFWELPREANKHYITRVANAIAIVSNGSKLNPVIENPDMD